MTPAPSLTWLPRIAGFPLLFLIIVGVDYFATGRWSARTLVLAALLSILAPWVLGRVVRLLIRVASRGQPR